MTRIGLINAEGITRGHSEASCSNDAATLGPSASAWDHGGRGERGRQALLRVRVEGLESGGYEVCARRGRVCRGAARWWLGWVRKSALVRVARCGRQHGGLRRGPAVAGRAAVGAARRPRLPRQFARRAPAAGGEVATRGRAGDVSGAAGLLPARPGRPGRPLRTAREGGVRAPLAVRPDARSRGTARPASAVGARGARRLASHRG
jgi:hypothetical protein